jgi:translocation and assembly module TamA
VLGGAFLEVMSVELDQWFGQRWALAAFFDAGNALSRASSHLAEGAGPGLRWRSPVGLLRADMAFPIAPHGRRPVFHLAMGPEL